MQGKFHFFKLAALAAVVIALLVAPALGQTKAQYDRYLKEFKAKMAKDLQLSPDQVKAMAAVEDKYSGERKEIIANLRKAGADLETALKAPTPDEAKIKGLVNAVTSSQDKLFATFKNERDEKLALLNTVQKGKYLLVIKEWRQEMLEKQEVKPGEKK
ncbi:MAG: periplasmic heavy metal sensor [Desulfobaccales bacterium]